MNIASIILIVCLYPFVLIMYFILKNDATPKKGMYYGVSLNKEQQNAPEVEQISKEYHKQMRLGLWVLLLMPLPMLFIPWFSIFMTAWMIWMLASIFVFFIPLGIANNKLKELKLKKGWNITQEPQIYTEIKDAGRIRRVKPYHFLLPSLVSIAIFIRTLLAQSNESTLGMSIMMGSFASVTFLLGLVAVWMDKQKTQIISFDSDVNVNYTRAQKNLWKNFWVICAWVNVAYMISMLFSLDTFGRFTGVFWPATLIYLLIAVILLLWLIKKKNALDASYQDKMDPVLTDDDDNYWIWGMVYYNPKDKHSMVEKRLGMGTTVNMATPAGKGFAVFGIVSLLSIPLLCIWLIMLEFTPIQLTIENNQVVANHLRQEYTVSLDSIQNVELLSELPKMSRNYGTSIDKLKKGSFRVADDPSCTVFLNPQNNVFICFESFGETYYLSGYDDSETMQVYEMLH